MNTPAKKRVTKKTASKTAKKSPRAAVDSAAAPAAEEPASAQAPKPKNILTAGIKALTSAHEEAVARQSRVFESLLGLKGLVPNRDESDKPVSTALDPFGFKKFEDVFDQRVARAIQRLAVPSSEVVARLETEVAALRDEVARLRAQLAKR
jgi:hypothetical protein